MSIPQVSEFFNSYAHDFDAIYGTRNSLIGSIINRLFRQSMKLRYLRTLRACSPVIGHSVLDIGCGPGHYSVALAKMGASEVLGIDFAESMLGIARKRASAQGVLGTCSFERRDFLVDKIDRRYDFTILMGIMDYITEPLETVRKAISLTKKRAFFSFPLDGGLLGWQRKLRYSSRCKLFLYSRAQVHRIFSHFSEVKFQIENLKRDLFVVADAS